MTVSLIVPTFNEAENVKTLYEAIIMLNLDKEVVVVDDFSPDGTIDNLKKASNGSNDVKILVRPKKMGLGSAYKDGLKLCSGDIIVEMDGDLSHNPQELPKIVRRLQDADIVVGSRNIKGGRVVGWKLHRRIINICANMLVRITLGLECRDSTSGYRAYKREVFERVALMSRYNSFEFQIEALYLAKKLGYKIVEEPITFTNRSQGKSKLKLIDIINFFSAIITLRIY